ncbi:MAG: response regulator transcription factor [Gammaproteobacteria bacterium]|nr:response regulator transcription factor [Gammaproteobacteria bacterium]MBU1724287.1 response regulator transcription factor [Gammaproteobacteria bacterium]MBU2006285.1 response regulator transcription factor [Gammaproteobacteria bacterium]
MLTKTIPRILIVDDDEILQNLLEEYLRPHGFKISCLSSGAKIADHLKINLPDLILLDIIMPGKNGLYWLAYLKRLHPHLPVLMLSAQSGANDRLRGLELGADDYLIKPFHPKELLIRLRKILGIKQPQANGYIKIGEQFFNPERELLLGKGQTIKLTTQEARLLTFFCKNAGQTLTRDALSQALHGSDHAPMDRKIDMQITRLRKKLEPDLGTPRHLHTVWRKGYRFTF